MDNASTIGVILLDLSGQGLTHDYFAAILESFRVNCEKRGYTMAFLNNDRERENSETYLEQVKRLGYAGVLIACIDYSEEIHELLASDVVIGAIDTDYEGAFSVKSDNINGIEHLTEFLVKMGHRRMAMITGDENEVSNLRLDGFLEVCKEHGIEIPEEYIRRGKFRDMRKATYNTEKLLNLDTPPSCILYSDDYAAIGGINALHARGVDIPEDISITGYDGVNILSQYEPRLTTVKQDTEGIGRIASERMIYHIEHPEDKNYEHIVVDTILEKGRTVADISHKLESYFDRTNGG